MKNKKKTMDLLDDLMSESSKKRADARSKNIIGLLNLAKIRRQSGLRQIDVKGFSQPLVSQIEKRSDIKLSTLIEYMESLGLGVKIIGVPKDKSKTEVEILSVGS